MPLEISYGAHVARRLNPSDRRLRPLIGPGAPQTGIHASRMAFEVIDQGGGGHDTALIHGLSICLAGHHPAHMEDQREAPPCAAVVFTPGSPQIVWEPRIG